MPRAYPVQFRQQAIALARPGRPVTQVAYELDIHPVTLHKWIRQDDIDHGRRPGTVTVESAELKAARRRIRELETELAIIKKAAQFLDPATAPHPKGSTR